MAREAAARACCLPTSASNDSPDELCRLFLSDRTDLDRRRRSLALKEVPAYMVDGYGR